jgi:hypothetical protein
MARHSGAANPNIPTTRNYVQEQQKETNPLYGLYKGVVTRTDDYTRSGKIQVFIATLAKDPTLTDGLATCAWTSPFAGITPVAGLGRNIEKYEETQKSYGMWMVPPDIGNEVLVAFGDGNILFPYIISCVFPNTLGYMIPGMASGKSYGAPDIAVPVAEKNTKDAKTTHNDANRPIAPYLAKSIVEQGLINDPIRGAGTASSRREAPSMAFGILTPGPLEANSPGTNTEVPTNRTGGHQFIMDDHPSSRMIRLRTAGGSQIMLDDTTQSIYMINQNGKGWVEINELGEINVYAEGGINFRTKGNFNIRADQNINIEAGQNIKIRAAGDNALGEYTGPPKKAGLGPSGTGGSIVMDAAADIKQYADQNFGITAYGGDIDLSGAGILKATSTTGIHLVSNTGPIAVQTPAALSLKAGTTIGIEASGFTAIKGKQVHLNSLPPVIIPGIKAKPVTALTAELAGRDDQPNATPKFDLEAALAGRSAMGNGKRSGKADTIKTIVGRLVTAEPYAGHGQGAKPGFDEPIVAASETATADLPPAASTQDGRPDDAQTPAGAKAGDGYDDSNGNPLTARARSAAASATTRAAGGAAGRALNRAASAASADLANLRNAIPRYVNVNAINDFRAAVEQRINEVLNQSAFIAAIKAQLPDIRFPTTNVLRQQILAGIKELRELEYQLRQFSLDSLGLPIDLNVAAIRDMQNQINGVMAQARDGLDAVNRLKELGIEVINDAGSLIYRDSLGNTLVDFSDGVGPVASSLAIQSEVARAYNNIKSAITVPINNNQSQALAAFARDIGVENFRNSNILDALNAGKYSEIPRLMAQWSLGPPVGATTPTPRNNLVYRQDLNDARYFQGQVFQSPDNLNIGPPEGTAAGGLTAREMGNIIKARREEFNAANVVGPTEYYGGPGR